jgi:transcriptional regulator with XRE-family HTH domain
MQEENGDIAIKCDTFGYRLHKLRKDKGLSQEKLASFLGYKRSGSISNIENDKTAPDIETLEKIAECLDVDLHWLITGKVSHVVEQLRIYTSAHIAEIYRKIAELRKKKAELELKKTMGEDCQKLLNETEKEIAELSKYGEALRKHLNSFLDSMGLGFH